MNGYKYEADRIAVRDHGTQLLENDLTEGGTGGNVSSRTDDDNMAISPSGIPYNAITIDDVPVLTFEGKRLVGEREASVEQNMHARIYQERPDVGGIVHTHSPYATTFAVLDRPIPASHYLVAFAGDKVPITAYESYGTPELAEEAVETLGNKYDACILQNHGVLALGENVEKAFEVAMTVEFCARVHYQAEGIGEPIELSAEEIADIRERVADYGQDPSA